jgi:ribonuclease E
MCLNCRLGRRPAEEEVEEPSQKIPEERPERREKVIHRADIPPAERVSVEMTPLEQDVYALMGVSPLVRLDREFKDPKSVIVTVRSPGEPEVIPEIPEKTAPSLRKEIPMSSNDFSDLAETNGKEDEKEWMMVIAEDSDYSNHFTNYTNPDQEIESAPEVVLESDAQEFEPIQEIEDKQEDPEQPVIRRRRRRSSAQEG